MSSEANSATRDRIISDLDELYSDLVELRDNTKNIENGRWKGSNAREQSNRCFEVCEALMHWPNCPRCGAIVTNEYHKCGDLTTDDRCERTLAEKLSLVDRTTRRQVERIVDKHLKSRRLL